MGVQDREWYWKHTKEREARDQVEEAQRRARRKHLERELLRIGRQGLDEDPLPSRKAKGRAPKTSVLDVLMFLLAALLLLLSYIASR